MAYNPFNVFRRNQRAIFAVVTVFIMFTFVLSSGLGGGADFFDWLPRWLGTKSQKGDVVCNIEGSKVYSAELEKLRFERVMANRFMSLAGMQTAMGLDNVINEQMTLASPDTRTVIRDFREAEQILQNPQLMQFLASNPTMMRQYQEKIDRFRALADSPKASSSDKQLARNIRYLRIIQGQLGRSQGEHYFAAAPNRTNRDLVDFMLWSKKADQLGIRFTTDDVKRMIDREFYGFFNAQAQIEIRKHLQQQMSRFNMDKCVEAIGQEFRVRAAQVAVLGAGAHGGHLEKTLGGYPMFNISYEMFEFYREECSPTTYGVIPVPAANYESVIPDPNENDPATYAKLRELFDKYKNDEPNLAREAPGLKEPRKIKVDWIAITGTEPYYTKLAEEELKAGEIQAKVGSMLTVPLPSTSPAWIVPAAAPVAAQDPLLFAEYEKIANTHRAAVRQSYERSNLDLADTSGFSTPPLDSSIVRPGNMAAGAGALAGQLLTHGDPRMAAAVAMTGPLAYEIRDRVKAGAPSILLALGTIPGVKVDVLGLSVGQPVPGPLPGPALFGNVMGGLAAYELMIPKPLPLAALKPDLMKTLIATTAKNLAFGDHSAPMRNTDAPGASDTEFAKRVKAAAEGKEKGDLQTFIDEVNKLSDSGKVRPSDKDKYAAVQKSITDFVSKRGIMIEGNNTPRSEWNLEEAPELAPLVEAQKRALQGSPHQQAAQYIPFARSFFWDPVNPRNPATTIYHPEYYPEQRPQPRSRFDIEAKPQYIVWRTEEIQAKTPASLADAMPTVKALWKHLKARDLARERAEKLAEAIRAGGQGSEVSLPFTLLDQSKALAAEFASTPKAQDRVTPFAIDGVCPLTTVINPSARKSLFADISPPASAPLHPFQFPPSENIKYPSRDMGQKLLDERTKPVKTVLVLADEPKDVYFVVTLMKREMKTDREFQAVMNQDEELMRMIGRTNNNKMVISENFNVYAARKTHESVMGLLKQEFNYQETEEQKKKLDERRNSDL